MNMITKIDLYNAPYEINSVDRFYKDIDNKLANYKAGETAEFSYDIDTTTDFTITVKDKEAVRGSYARIESSIFKNKPVSYWFLTEINGIESKDSTKYKCKLDAIATFGEEIFEKLDGMKIKIDRLHEDRYVFDAVNAIFNLNKAHHGLINTDFKLGDTKGVELVYDGAEEEKSGSTTISAGKVNGRWENALGTTGLIWRKGEADFEIKNELVKGNKKYYLYAIMQMKGSPKIYSPGEEIKTNIHNFEYVDADDKLIYDKAAIKRNILIPINAYGEDDAFDPDKKPKNTIGIIEKLQEDKIINIIKLPYKLDLGEGFQLLFGKDNKRYSNVLYTSDGFGDGSYLIDEEGNQLDEKNGILYPSEGGGGQVELYELFAYRTVTSFNDDDIISIPTSKLDAPDIMDFIANTKTPAEMKRIIDAGETERLEIGLLNPEIMPIEMHFHDNKTILDFYNFANKVDKTKIKGSYVFNEMGLEVTLKISENQFAGWSENQIMSFSTDQGATYLARHKYTNDAQKKSIDLSAQQAALSAHLQKLQGKDQAGNLVSGLFSLGASTAAGAHTADYAGRIEALQPKIADAKKQEIQGEIDDASATAPSVHIGSSHNLINLNTQEFKHNHNWVMKKPNKFLRDKIVNFLDRHGYSYKDWVPFKKEMVESRSKFDFIQMSEFKDFIGTFNDFDINVLQLVDAEFKKGLRLWHEDTINYNTPNIEISIKKEIAKI